MLVQGSCHSWTSLPSEILYFHREITHLNYIHGNIYPHSCKNDLIAHNQTKLHAFFIVEISLHLHRHCREIKSDLGESMQRLLAKHEVIQENKKGWEGSLTLSHLTLGVKRKGNGNAVKLSR